MIEPFQQRVTLSVQMDEQRRPKLPDKQLSDRNEVSGFTFVIGPQRLENLAEEFRAVVPVLLELHRRLEDGREELGELVDAVDVEASEESPESSCVAFLEQGHNAANNERTVNLPPGALLGLRVN